MIISGQDITLLHWAENRCKSYIDVPLGKDALPCKITYNNFNGLKLQKWLFVYYCPFSIKNNNLGETLQFQYF